MPDAKLCPARSAREISSRASGSCRPKAAMRRPRFHQTHVGGSMARVPPISGASNKGQPMMGGSKVPPIPNAAVVTRNLAGDIEMSACIR
jgi:hypothetical protein